MPRSCRTGVPERAALCLRYVWSRRLVRRRRLVRLRHGTAACQHIGHQLLKAAVAGDGVDIDDERWRPHVAQGDDRDCEAREAKHVRSKRARDAQTWEGRHGTDFAELKRPEQIQTR